MATRTATAKTKRGEKNRKGIDGSVPKEKEGDNFNNTKCKYM